MHEALRASSETGNRHILIIEEGHRLARETIRHFKGFYELEDGFTSLLSILIIGQTELDWKLGENDFDVREVVQRLEKRYLDPIDNDVEGYLRHKFERVAAHRAKPLTSEQAALAMDAQHYLNRGQGFDIHWWAWECLMKVLGRPILADLAVLKPKEAVQ